jgi:hypothetical protein
LFDFNNNVNNEEIHVLKEMIETVRQEVSNLQNTYSHVEEALNELILNKEDTEQVIQKRQNPYEQKVQDIVAVQRELEKEDDEVVEKTNKFEPEQLTLDSFENTLPTSEKPEEFEEIVEVEKEELETIEEQNAVVEEEPETIEEQKEVVEEEPEAIEIPEEMTRSIDDLFNNPVFFNNPLVESKEEKTVEQVVEEKTVVEEKPKPELPVEPKKYMTIEDFEREVEEEKHYELTCNIQNLELGLRKMASLENVPLEVLNYVVLDLYGMKDDIQMFINDKNNGVLDKDPLLEKDAKRNIKTFLITISVREAMVSATKDKEVKKLIEEIKVLIKEFRNPKQAMPVIEPVMVKEESKPQISPVQSIVEEPKEEKVETVQFVEEPVEEDVEKLEIQPENKEPVFVEPVVEQPIVEEKQEEKIEIEAISKEEVQSIEIQNKPENNKPSFQLDNLIIKEEEQPQPQVVNSTYKRSTIIETRPRREETSYPTYQNDNPYAIEKIEMVMHDSRSEISREERKIILNNWRRLADRVGAALLPVARFLIDGNPVVNGNNCIIITYPNAALCNHIMGDKIRVQAKQILKITFGREYDFIALPENIWQDKRNEYRGQYQMGTVYPKLTPINNPELKIVKKSFVDEKNSSYNKAVDLFGKNLIREEE